MHFTRIHDTTHDLLLLLSSMRSIGRSIYIFRSRVYLRLH